jgi:phosphoglycolate phosphatase
MSAKNTKEDSQTLYDGLIFDLDGTLWDSTAPVASGFNQAMRKVLGKTEREIGVADIMGIMGMPHRQVFETLFPDTPEIERESLAKRCYDEEIAAIRALGAALYPGVAEGLPRLAKHYPLFIVSNCQTPYLDTFFEWTGMQSLFKDVECHGRTGKPKGENIRVLCERNELVRAAYIGDTSGDQEAAIFAGLNYYHVSYGFGQPSRSCRQFETFHEVVTYFTE